MFIAAGITTVVVTLLIGLLARRAAPGEGRGLLLAGLLALPLHPLAFHLLRVPMHEALTSALGPGTLLLAVTLLYAPLTEEPAKWLVLLPPPMRRALRPGNALGYALAVGLGFAIGEVWFLADRFSRAPGGTLPFYAHGGFLVERLQVAFLHGAFIAFVAQRLAEGRRFLPGALLGMALHFALNAPILLIQYAPLGIGVEVWAQLVGFWTLAMAIGLLVVLSWARPAAAGATAALRSLMGNSTCPECGAVYTRRVLAVNVGVRRYERCPACQHFHWVR